MPELIIYLIKANIALCLFYLAYRLGLRRLTFYTLNRFFLVSGIIFSSLFPLVDVNDFFNRNEMAQQVITFVPDLNTWQAVPPDAFTVWALMEWIFWAGVGVMFLRLMVQLASLLLLHRKTAPGTVLQRNVRLMHKAMNPFSFFRNIYVNPSLHSEEELTAILDHEAVHVKEWHTADVMLGEMNNVFYWFNPGAWLMKTAIRENLEFLTDRAILRSGMDPKAYQYSLIQVNTSPYATGIANNFNFSHLKNRISMMNKRNSSRLHIYRYAVLACLVCGVLLSLNFTKPGTVVDDVVTEVRTAFADPGATVKDAVAGVGSMLTGKEDTTAPALKKGQVVEKVKSGSTHGKWSTVVIENHKSGVKDTLYVSSSGVSGNLKKNKAIGIRASEDSVREVRTVTGRPNIVASGITTGTNSVTVYGNSAGQKPLLVVDGEVQLNEDISHIKPENIAAISVLKGESAAVRYGSAGSNGVILVTTKPNTKGSKAVNGLNEVKVLEVKPTSARSDNGLEEVIVTGRKSNTLSAGTKGDNGLEEVIVTGRKSNTLSAGTKSDNGLEEVIVTGRKSNTLSAGVKSDNGPEEVIVTGRKRNTAAEPRVMKFTTTTTVTTDSARTPGLALAPSASLKSNNLSGNIFPNPTNGLVNVSFYVPKAGNGYLEVLDLEGKRVYYKSLNGFSGSFRENIDLKNKPAGTYVMNISFADGTRMSSKIVKQ